MFQGELIQYFFMLCICNIDAVRAAYITLPAVMCLCASSCIPVLTGHGVRVCGFRSNEEIRLFALLHFQGELLHVMIKELIAC